MVDGPTNQLFAAQRPIDQHRALSRQGNGTAEQVRATAEIGGTKGFRRLRSPAGELGPGVLLPLTLDVREAR